MLVNSVSKMPSAMSLSSSFFGGGKFSNSVDLSPQDNNQEQKKFSTTKKVSAAVLATALSATMIAGGVLHGKNKTIKTLEGNIGELRRGMNELQEDVVNLRRDNGELKSINNNLNGSVSQLHRRNGELQSANSALNESKTAAENELARIKQHLRNLTEAPDSAVSQTEYAQMERKINSAELDYDITQPPVTGRTNVRERARSQWTLPDSVGTDLRSDIREVNIPAIGSDGHFNFSLPHSKETKIVKGETTQFTPMKNVSTSISESYADSVQWNNDKIARDIVQNFFDGHGQTLDGVRFRFEPSSNGNYRVRIEGDSTYSPDKAVYMGESTKRNDAKAAGNFGEGIKMAALKLLRDKGAKDVKIGSENWEVAYSLQKGNLSDKRVLTYSLDEVRPYDGNFIEFETSDKELLESLRKTINRFYSHSNVHFKNPEFENATFGIKILGGENEKGALYIAGQRFEFDGDYDGLKGVALYLKEKPPVSVLDPSRDRTSINTSQLQKIAEWLARNKTTEKDKLNVIKALERYMDKKDMVNQKAIDDFLDRFVYYCDLGNHSFHNVNFPEKYVAYSPCTPDVLQRLYSNGYKVCKENFTTIGMPTIKDIFGEASKHTALQPTESQERKIKILKEAINVLSPQLHGNHFTSSELNPKIYIFDRHGAKESSTSSNVAAEAIIDNGLSKGFWVDGNYLDSATFGDILETALHELSHKAGGDYTSEFSYKLTDVNKDVLDGLITNPQMKEQINALGKLWNVA